MSRQNAYQDYDFTRFYDWSYQGYEQDIAFFATLAGTYGSPILEVACGTGRIIIPLARCGVQVVGIDLSDHMLDIARCKLSKEPDYVRDRVSFTQADMRGFDLGSAFAAAFIPNASVFHLPDTDALLACFSCLYKHIVPGGIAVIDVVAPARMANQVVDVENKVGEGINPSTQLLTREFNKKLRIDHDNQFVKVLHTYVECCGNEERVFVFEQNYRWMQIDEGITILSSAGFADVKAMGDYDGSPYNIDSPRLILMAHRAR